MRDYKVYYGIPTYTQAWRAKNAIQHIINTSSLVPDQFVVIDNSGIGSAIDVLKPLTDVYSKVQVLVRQQNILAGAWNDLMQLWDDDYIIIANDDVTPHPQSIEALVTLARDNPDYAMVNGSGHSGNSYSFFLLRKWAYQLVGAFDENFKPAYYEDNDYDYRLVKLLNLKRVESSDATFDHIVSATMKAMTEEQKARHHVNFAATQAYYVRKWGGLPTNEQFTTPFQRGTTLDDD